MTKRDFFSIFIWPEDWQEIRAQAARLSNGGAGLNRRTAMAGQRDNRHAASGPAGELAFRASFPGVTRESTPDYDFITPAGTRIDVKTRSGKTLARDDFDVRVPRYSYVNQKCDVYVFAHAVWADDVITVVQLLGWCRKSEFGAFAELRSVEDATAQASGFDQREGHADLMVAVVNKLRPMAELKELP